MAALISLVDFGELKDILTALERKQLLELVIYELLINHFKLNFFFFFEKKANRRRSSTISEATNDDNDPIDIDDGPEPLPSPTSASTPPPSSSSSSDQPSPFDPNNTIVTSVHDRGGLSDVLFVFFEKIDF